MSSKINNSPLISVIIPVYNVEPFLKKCVESVCHQTYKNLEIIIVNDGSTDQSGKICEELAQKDTRIKILHKNNGGLSSARNAGLNIASGEYVGFVDSDDYIAYDMYEILLNALLENDINIGISSGQILKDVNGIISPYNSKWDHNSKNIIQPNEFAERMILTGSNFTCWSKLYRRDLLNKIRFLEGRNNEDSFFIFDVSKEIENMELYTIEIPNYIYYYRIREGSICNTISKPLEIDVISNFMDFQKYYYEHNRYLLAQKIEQYIIYRLFDLIHKLYKNENLYQLYYKKYIRLLRNQKIANILKNRYLNIQKKIRILLVYYIPYLYRKFLIR